MPPIRQREAQPCEARTSRPIHPRHAMPSRSTHLRIPPFADTLPAPIWFRADELPADTAYPRHRHAWGEFVYAYSGLMELKLADAHFLAPPQCGVWLPPQVEHVGLNRDAASHCSLYVSEALCAQLPGAACALTVSPLVRSLLEHLRQHPHARDKPPLAEEARLLQVLVDQLAQAPRAGSYLPGSDDAVLAPLLRALDAQPGDNRSLAEWAQAVHSTERTLLRRCRRELGMSFSEWRQRLRVVKALPRLQAGQKVEVVALELGYADASAFITMFRRLMGVTPDEFRRGATPP
jgi:AraC-like DNA-binding protein